MSEQSGENDAALVAVKALADSWAEVLQECKQADPRWILDRSVTTLETSLNELRRALDTRVTPPVLSDMPEPIGIHCRGCGWSSGGHGPGCPIPPASSHESAESGEGSDDAVL